VDPSRRRFFDELGGLRILLDMIATVEEASSLDLGDDPAGALEILLARLRPFAQPTRLHRAEYAIAIAFGYAAFERFIRDLLESMAHALSEPVAAYVDLSEDFRKHHLALSLRAATVAAERGSTTPTIGLLTTLLECLHGNVPFSVNEEVFSEHSANFRSDVIRSSFRRLGIRFPEAVRSAELDALVKSEFAGLYARPSSVVDDLADRRNVVAHGGEVDLLDRRTLRSLLTFLEMYANALCTSLFEGVLEQLAPKISRTIGEIDHSWQTVGGIRSIGRLRPVGGTVGVGDVVVLTGGASRLAAVRSIEFEHEPLPECGPSEATFGVDFGVPVNEGDRVLVFPNRVIEAMSAYVEPGYPS
jgi:hypothetical protein